MFHYSLSNYLIFCLILIKLLKNTSEFGDCRGGGKT